MPLVKLRAYRDPIEAELDRAHLELDGITAFVVDDNLVSMQWDLSAAVGGVKLEVVDEDFARADALLGEDRSALLAGRSPLGSVESERDRCPACRSIEVARSSTRPRWAALALLSGLPLVFGRTRSVCRTCGHVWRRRSADPPDLTPETILAERAVQQRVGGPSLLLIVLAAIGLLWSSRHWA